MLDQQRRCALQHFVEVVWQPAVGRLEILEGDLTLQTERDTVVWRFRNLNDGLQPAIVFEGDHPLGPFASLDQLPNRVLGMGNLGRLASGPERQRYHALLADVRRPLDDPFIESSGAARVTNPIHTSYSPLDVRVTPGVNDSLRVDPMEADIFTGQPVTWHFRDLPLAIYRPVVEFTEVPAGALPRGPFESLTVSPPSPGFDGGYSVRVIGAGTASKAIGSGVRGVFRYRIRAVRLDGSGELHTLPGGDPQIDDMGPPPDGLDPVQPSLR